MATQVRKPRGIWSLKHLLVRWNTQLDAIENKCIVRHWHQLNNVERLIVVLEDKRFLRHHGIDWQSVLRILCQSLIGKRVGGASTIEMQLIRTVLDLRQRTLSRKLNEFVLAWLLNYRIDKISMLYSYSQIAFLGSHIQGADAASKLLFNKPSDELTLQEAVLIAAMLVYPRPLEPTEIWMKKVQRRARYGLAIYTGLEQRGDQISK